MSGLVGLAALSDDVLAAIGASGGASKLGLTPTAVKTAGYTAAPGDFVPVDTTAGNVTVTFPTAPADGAVVAVKHVAQGGSNTVGLALGGSDKFNTATGATTGTLTLLNQGIVAQYKATTGVWYLVASDLPLSGLTGTYAQVVALTGAGIDTTGATDSTTALNALLAASAGKRVRGIPGASYLISAPLVLPAGGNVELDMTGCTITLKTGSNCRMLWNYAASVASGRDTNISIRGGSWVRANGNATPTDNNLHSIFIRYVDGLSIRDLKFTSTDSKYGISLGDVTQFRVENYRVNSYSDGIHLHGPASRGYIGQVSGTAGDDMVGITTQDYPAYDDVHGVITDVTVERIDCTPLSTSQPNAVLVAGAGGYAIQRISVRDVTALNNSSGVARAVTVLGTTDDITLQKIAGNVTITYQSSTGWNGNGVHGKIRIIDQRFVPGVGSVPAVSVTADGASTYTCTVRRLEISGGVGDGASTYSFPYVAVSAAAVVTELSVSDVEHIGSTGQGLVYCFGANSRIQYVTVARCHRDGIDYSGARVVNVDTTGRIDNIYLSQVVAKKCQYAVNASGSTSTVVIVAGCDISDTTNSIRAAVIAVDLRVTASTMSDVTTVGGGTIRSRTLDAICDVSKLAANVGDMANNTSNANTGTLGVGGVVCIATTAPKWKSLVSGNTW